MPLLPATLAGGMSSMTPTESEASAIALFADAYVLFMSTAQCGPIPIVPAALNSAPKAAMIAAMSGFSTDGATAIQNGCLAFWGAMVPLAATLFPSALVLSPPPPLSGLAASLTPVFLSNTQGNLDLASACQSIALAIYTSSLGGLATIPMPAPTPTPIL